LYRANHRGVASEIQRADQDLSIIRATDVTFRKLENRRVQAPHGPAQQTPLRRFHVVPRRGALYAAKPPPLSATFTNCFPRLPPLYSRSKAAGAFSNPSNTSAWAFISPALSQPLISARASFACAICLNTNSPFMVRPRAIISM